jgi:hypothetical protein
VPFRLTLAWAHRTQPYSSAQPQRHEGPDQHASRRSRAAIQECLRRTPAQPQPLPGPLSRSARAGRPSLTHLTRRGGATGQMCTYMASRLPGRRETQTNRTPDHERECHSFGQGVLSSRRAPVVIHDGRRGMEVPPPAPPSRGQPSHGGSASQAPAPVMKTADRRMSGLRLIMPTIQFEMTWLLTDKETSESLNRHPVMINGEIRVFRAAQQ